MGMTITEKILAKAAGLDSVHSGQLIMADLSMVLGNDITSPVAIKEFPKFGKMMEQRKLHICTILNLVMIIFWMMIVLTHLIQIIWKMNLI